MKDQTRRKELEREHLREEWTTWCGMLGFGGRLGSKPTYFCRLCCPRQATQPLRASLSQERASELDQSIPKTSPSFMNLMQKKTLPLVQRVFSFNPMTILDIRFHSRYFTWFSFATIKKSKGGYGHGIKQHLFHLIASPAFYGVGKGRKDLESYVSRCWTQRLRNPQGGQTRSSVAVTKHPLHIIRG